MVKLYITILSNENKIYSNEITEKEIYQIIFRKDSYSYSTIRNLMSSLYQMCDEFLVLNSLTSNKKYVFQNDLKLLTEYSKRFLDRNYELKYEKVDGSLDYMLMGSKYFDYKFDLNLNLHNFDALRSNFLNDKNTLYKQNIYNICKVISILSEDVTTLDYLRNSLNFSANIKPALSLFTNLNVTRFLGN